MVLCDPWFCVGMGWLPISVGVTVAATVAISYSISVGLGHVPAEFPYISDTGTYTPESCIFGQLLNIAAGLAFATIYIRYKHVIECQQYLTPRVLLWNKIALVLGSLAALGMSMVANFQETSVMTCHATGAYLCFVLGILYSYINTWISYRMIPLHSSPSECTAQLICSCVGTVAFITSILSCLFVFLFCFFVHHFVLSHFMYV